MTQHEPASNIYGVHEDAVRRAYADVALSPDQHARHKQRLANTATRRDVPRAGRPAGELVAIASAALVLLIAVVVWQSLDPMSDGAPAGVDAPPAETGSAVLPRQSPVASGRQQALPFAPPDSCPVSDWIGPENRDVDVNTNDYATPDGWASLYSVDGSGISLMTPTGVLYEGENTVVWLRATYQPQDIVYAAERLDGEAAPATFTFEGPATAPDREGRRKTVQEGTITFPASGCWQITVESQDSSLRKVVYAYPADTRLADD